MPRSRLRLRKSYTPPPTRAPVKLSSPRWLVPLMLAFFVIGLLWIVVYYITEQQLPIEAIGPWNIAVGFGFIAVGFALSTQWR